MNRLTSATETGPDGTQLFSAAYSYDVFGNLIEQDTSGAGSTSPEVQRYAYVGQQVWADLNGVDQITTRYLAGAGPNQVLARVGADGSVGWYLTDHLGSVRDIVDSTGTVLDKIGYDSFGNVASESNPAPGDRFRFAGMRSLVGVGLYFDHARDYDAATGTFTTQDPTGFAAGDSNTYRYVGNDPVNAMDPTGEFSFWGTVDYLGTLAEGAGTGALDGAASVVDTVTLGYVWHERAQAAQAEAVQRGDTLSQVGFGAAKVGGHAIQGIVIVGTAGLAAPLIEGTAVASFLSSSAVTTAGTAFGSVVTAVSAVNAAKSFASGDIINGVDNLGNTVMGFGGTLTAVGVMRPGTFKDAANLVRGMFNKTTSLAGWTQGGARPILREIEVPELTVSDKDTMARQAGQLLAQNTQGWSAADKAAYWQALARQIEAIHSPAWVGSQPLRGANGEYVFTGGRFNVHGLVIFENGEIGIIGRTVNVSIDYETLIVTVTKR